MFLRGEGGREGRRNIVPTVLFIVADGPCLRSFVVQVAHKMLSSCPIDRIPHLPRPGFYPPPPYRVSLTPSRRNLHHGEEALANISSDAGFAPSDDTFFIGGLECLSGRKTLARHLVCQNEHAGWEVMRFSTVSFWLSTCFRFPIFLQLSLIRKMWSSSCTIFFPPPTTCSSMLYNFYLRQPLHFFTHFWAILRCRHALMGRASRDGLPAVLLTSFSKKCPSYIALFKSKNVMCVCVCVCRVRCTRGCRSSSRRKPLPRHRPDKHSQQLLIGDHPAGRDRRPQERTQRRRAARPRRGPP